jgi:hypothetical protein
VRKEVDTMRSLPIVERATLTLEVVTVITKLERAQMMSTYFWTVLFSMKFIFNIKYIIFSNKFSAKKFIPALTTLYHIK